MLPPTFPMLRQGLPSAVPPPGQCVAFSPDVLSLDLSGSPPWGGASRGFSGALRPGMLLPFRRGLATRQSLPLRAPPLIRVARSSHSLLPGMLLPFRLWLAARSRDRTGQCVALCQAVFSMLLVTTALVLGALVEMPE